MKPQESPKCPKCQTVMVQHFDYKERAGMTLAIPNGKYGCIKCGYESAAIKDKP